MSEQGSCNVAGCPKPAATRGLCHACYFQAAHHNGRRHAECKAAMLPSRLRKYGQRGGGGDETGELIASATEAATGLGLTTTLVAEGLAIIRPATGAAMVITPGGATRKGRLVCAGPSDDKLIVKPERVDAVVEALGELGVKSAALGAGRLLVEPASGRMIRLDPAGMPHAARLELDAAS